jgi:4-amino-4-deoxy-L-arabinose transferase-like glycosyltransferase
MLRSVSASIGRRNNRLLPAALLMGLVSHVYNLFHYPLYLTDEGIYIQQAWSVLRQMRLAPYTYTYDHAPFGWITLAGWTAILPGQFHAFGNAINTGRALMIPIHLASVFFLFEITRRFSGGNTVAAFLATAFFNLSPLAVIYQRMVLLDNLMVFWLLLGLYLISKGDDRITTALGAGLAFGLAIVTKENALFLVPVMVFVLYRRVQGRLNRRFARGFFFFAGGAPVAFYLLYAALKRELVPAGWNFNLATPPVSRVSLLYTVWWQLHRSQGSALAPGSFLGTSWLPKDRFLLIGGAIATVILLMRGFRDHRRNEAELAAGLLAALYAFYLIRGSVLLDFYVVPMVPLLALNVGLVLGGWLRSVSVQARVGGVAVLSVALLSPIGGYFFVHGTQGQIQVADMYRLHLTDLQTMQLNWVEANIPKTARLIIDDDMWVPLREAGYSIAHSHYKAAADPTVRDKLFQQDWHNIDYIVMSNKMRQAMVLNNGGGGEGWILDALDNHSQEVWQVQRGGIALSVRRVG